MLHAADSATSIGLAAGVTLVPLLVVPFAWHAARIALAGWRRFAQLTAIAFSLQAAAGATWFATYALGDGRPPSATGAWTLLLYAALLAAGLATWSVSRSRVRVRDTAIDFTLILAATACLAAATVDRSMLDDLGVIDAATRSLLGMYLVVSIGSAVWGRWPGGPALLACFGLCLGAYVLCSALQAIAAAGTHVGKVLPGALWVLAALSVVVLLRVARNGPDRAVRIGMGALPGVSPVALTLWWAIAWTIAVAVGAYGATAGNVAVLTVALVAVGWIGLVGVLRAVSALRAAHASYLELDDAMFGLEQAADRPSSPTAH